MRNYIKEDPAAMQNIQLCSLATYDLGILPTGIQFLKITIIFWTISYYSPGMKKMLHFTSVTSNAKAIFTMSGMSHLNGITMRLQHAWTVCLDLSQYINLIITGNCLFQKAQIILRVITLTQLQR